MSYDLSFVAREGASFPEPDALRAYFGERPSFEVSEDRFAYLDPKNGAQFELRLGEGLSLTVPSPVPYVAVAAAREEIFALLERFPLAVQDPQVDSTVRNDWSPGDFARSMDGYNRNLLVAYLVHMGMAVPVHHPGARLARVFAWNRAAAASTDDSVYIPTIEAGRTGEAPVTWIAWHSDGPIRLPPPDLVDVVVSLGPEGQGLLGPFRALAEAAAHVDGALDDDGDIAAARAALRAASEPLVPGEGFAAVPAKEVYQREHVLLPIAMTHYHAERDEEAIAAFDAWLALAPDDADAWFSRAHAQFRLGRHAEAFASTGRALAIRPHGGAQQIRCVTAFYQARWQDCIDVADQILADSPDNHNLRSARAVALTELGRHDEAEAEFAVICEAEADPMYQNSRADNAAAAGRAEDAAREFSAAAAKLRTALTENEEGDVASRLSYALLGLGQHAEARTAAERALELSPDDVLVLVTAGRSRIATGAPADAIEPLRKALAVRPGHVHADYHLARALALTGDKDAARTHLARATAGTPRLAAQARQDEALAAL